MKSIRTVLFMLCTSTLLFASTSCTKKSNSGDDLWLNGIWRMTLQLDLFGGLETVADDLLIISGDDILYFPNFSNYYFTGDIPSSDVPQELFKMLKKKIENSKDEMESTDNVNYQLFTPIFVNDYEEKTVICWAGTYFSGRVQDGKVHWLFRYNNKETTTPIYCCLAIVDKRHRKLLNAQFDDVLEKEQIRFYTAKVSEGVYEKIGEIPNDCLPLIAEYRELVERSASSLSNDNKVINPPVYSNAFDGFVNMRKEPSYSAEKVGKLKNGSEGAVLLEDKGDWKKVDVSGTIGWVPSKYLQSTPTIEYTGEVDAEWLEGIWGADGGYVLMLFNNGVWEYGYDDAIAHGKYIMQNNEVKLIPTWVMEDLDAPDDILQINKGADKVGIFSRGDYLSQEEKEDGMGGYGVLTKSDFKAAGKALLKEVENGK